MIMGSGRVSLLSGRIWCYRVGLPPLRGCVLGRPLGRVSCMREKAGWAANRFWPIRLGKIENPFFNFIINFKLI
jgi:hypothetical protein